MQNRDVIYSELDSKQRANYEQFEQDALAHHVKPRDGRPGNTFILDKRNALLGHGDRETLRDPADPQWPKRGRTTTDEVEAKAWVKSAYIPALWQARQAATVHPSAGHLTWAEGAERLVRHYEVPAHDRNGVEVRTIPSRYRSRVSMIRQHVIPAFGAMLMAGTTRTLVREEAEALRVTRVRPDGTEVKRPAKHGTKLNFVSAMVAIWNHSFPDISPPFAGLVIRPPAVVPDEEPSVVYDLENLQDELRAQEGKGGLSPDEVRRALVGAMHRDLALMSRPNIAKGGMVPNTAYLFALLVALGVRISEARKIRWADIDFQRGFVLIHQSKLHTNKRGEPKPKLRIVPLQDSLLPWLEELRVASGIVDPAKNKAFVFRTTSKGRADRMAAQNTLVTRATKALKYAGVKPVGYATHWGRATHASWGKHAPGLKGEELQHFLGHVAFKGTTEAYTGMIISMLQEPHRRYIPLPTPAEIRAELPSFEPETLDWRSWRTFQPRTKAAKAARRQRRLAKKPLSTSLDRRPVLTIA